MVNNMKVRLAEQIIDQTDVDQLVEWIQSTDRFTKGEQTLLFEEEWSRWLGSKYSVFVNSGSSANFLMFLGLLHSGKLRNKKVIVPAVSWVTTVSPAMQLGFEPIVCDCDPDDLGLSVEHFEQLCKTHDPSAVIIVHVLGHANKLKKIKEICSKYDVVLLEDSCEAPGSEYECQKLGTFGLASSFSFFYGHQISTIEGGMISTDDRDFYNLLISLRSHGWLRDNEKYFQEKYLSKYKVSEFESNYFFLFPGVNMRSTDLNAYIGRNQLKKMDKYVETRNKNYEKYCELIKDKYWVQKSNTNLISSLGFGIMSEDRDQLVSNLIKNDIECRPLICGSIQEHPFWFENYEKVDLPNATKVHQTGFYIPCHQNMSIREIEFVCQSMILKA